MRPASPGVFVVSTGRCGSTLISTTLRRHPAVASISEFLTCLGPHVFSTSVDVRSQLTRPEPHLSLLLRHHIEYPELCYDLDAGTYGREGLPPLLAMTLPHLEPDTGAAERLFDELVAAIGDDLAVDDPANGYLRVFRWLQQRDESAVWVERSGGSLRQLPRLVAAYPTARFVHVYRDGWPTAVSMSRHSGFRLAVLVRKMVARLGCDPFVVPEHQWRSKVDALDEPLQGLLPGRFTRDAFEDLDWQLRDFAAMWSGLVATGVRTLSALDPERVMHVRYESILEDPERLLAEIGRFVTGDDEPRWAAEAAGLVDPGRCSVPEPVPEVATRWLAAGRSALHGAGLPTDG